MSLVAGLKLDRGLVAFATGRNDLHIVAILLGNWQWDIDN